MNDLGLNKIAAAVLASALGFFAIKEISHLTFSHHGPETPAYALEIPEVKAGGEAAIELPFPTAEWVAAMDPVKGAKVFKKCVSCHNADQGGKNGTGPNLWSVVGKAAGQVGGFKYSGAMSGSGITWDFENLDGFLAKPTKYLKGTNMNFIGLKKEADRAAVIAYLQGQSDNPVASPKAAEVMMEDGAKDAAMIDGAVDKAEAMKDDVMLDAGEKMDAMKEIVKEGGAVHEGLVEEEAMAKELMKDKLESAKDEVKDIVTDVVKDKAGN